MRLSHYILEISINRMKKRRKSMHKVPLHNEKYIKPNK